MLPRRGALRPPGALPWAIPLRPCGAPEMLSGAPQGRHGGARGIAPGRRMPPEPNKPLTPREVALLRAWIDQGLPWDDALLPPPAAPAHWAFRPIGRPAVPAGGPTPIDAFLARARRERGLVAAAEA